MLKNFTFKDGLILLLVLSCIFFATPRKVRKAIKEQLLTRNAGPINHPTYPALEQKPFVIVIASYNNESVCELNLASVFSQHYTNYRVIYIDDASTDHTYERVKRVAEHHPIELIHNTSRQGKLTNLYRAYQSCADHEIIVCLDGDDWLAHPGVLQRLNLAYNNPDVWMTYGSAILHPNLSFHNKFIPKNIILKNTIRNFPFCMSMLRSFYAGLFKQIQLKDLFYQGQFLPTADDVGFMIPMAEMAGKHSLYISDILYVINDHNPIREHRTMETLQNIVRQHIQEQKTYTPLGAKFSPKFALAPQSTWTGDGQWARLCERFGAGAIILDPSCENIPITEDLGVISFSKAATIPNCTAALYRNDLQGNLFEDHPEEVALVLRSPPSPLLTSTSSTQKNYHQRLSLHWIQQLP